MSRRFRWLLRACALAATFMVPAAAAATQAPVAITLEPIPIGKTTTAVERVANGPGQADTWILNANVVVRNTGTSSIILRGYSLSTPTQVRAETLDVAIAIRPGASARVQVKQSFTGNYPLPSVSGTFDFYGYDQSARTFTLSDMKHQTPSGAYYLPYKSSDLPAGGLWTNFETQTNQSHHYGDPAQVYAYDLFVTRWNGNDWTTWKAGSPSTNRSNTDYLAFGLPVYAPDDGTILECRRSLADLKPGTTDEDRRFGNVIWMRTGTGEVMAIAHLKQNSMPANLCPSESVAADDNNGTPVHAQAVTVRAGQLIGRVGNTGNTSEPHTHIQLDRNTPGAVDDEMAPTAAPGLPLMWHRFRATVHRDSVGSTQSFQTVGDATPRALPAFGLFRPNSPCSWLIVAPSATEAAANLSGSCFQAQFNDLTRQGLLPTNLDGMRARSATSFNVVARRNRPGTVARVGLTASEFQTQRNTLEDAGYRLIDIDNYLDASTVRYSGVWAKTTGPAEAVYHGASQSTHQSQFNTLTAQGFRPRVVSVTNSSNGLVFSAIYEQSGASGFLHEVTPESDFQSRFDLRTSQGLRPLDIDGYNVGSTPYLSVTWDNVATTDYSLRFGLPYSTWSSVYGQQLGLGRRTASMTGYESAGAARYASIWRK